MKRKFWMALMLSMVVTLSACGGTDAEGAQMTQEAVLIEDSADGNSEDNSEENIEGADEGTDEAKDSDSESSEEAESIENEIAECPLEDGIYIARFDTDSSMFHINETLDGKGILTVENGKMTIHAVLAGKGITNLYCGLAEDAEKEGTVLLDAIPEEVTYPDGLSEEVYAFDIPVPYLEDEFDVALIGKKEVWYDHKVSVSDVQPYNENAGGEAAEVAENVSESAGHIGVTLEGGSGKSTITSPAKIEAASEGGYILTVEWSSPNYDYMLVGDEKYLPVNTDGNSVFELHIDSIDTPLQVIADTVAMSTPHEIEYTITFDASGIQ